MEKIVASVEGIIFRNEDNGYTVAEIALGDELETCVGMLPGLREGERVELSGTWKTHPSYGRQFAVDACRPLPPEGEEGLVRYLASGVAPGVGEATARRIVEAFGQQALDIIHYDPERLKEVSGIGDAKAEAIAEALSQHLELQEVMVFLQSLEIGQALAAKIYKAYGDKTMDVVRADPYRLAGEVEGVGFLTADRIARRLNIEPGSPTRARAGIRHVLNAAGMNRGHCCLPSEELIAQAHQLLGDDAQSLNQVLEEMLLNRELVLRQMQEQVFCYLPSYYYAENQTAAMLSALAAHPITPPFADMEAAVEMSSGLLSISLSQQQRQAVEAAALSGVVVITGGPGTGKTTVIRCILEVLTQAGNKVELAAPTGRAAKRMAQAAEHEARTLHRLLEYAFDGESGSFQRDESNPLECDAVIVDEVSMVDIFLMQSLVRAMTPGMRLILVGDSDQLPSVGPGMVLRDVMDSGVAKVCRLTEIFRQAQESMIVVNAHRVNEGQMPQLRSGRDFFFENRATAEAVYQSVEAMIATRIPGYLKCDGFTDIQVLVPMRKGELGVLRLNQRLQQAFNPPDLKKAEFSHGDRVFREGDKVMQIKNNYQIEYRMTNELGVEEEGKGVFNGDAGVIMRIDGTVRCFEILFDDGKLVRYEYAQAEEISLAYAISIHKSQGSEFPVVILPLLGGPEMLLTRNLLYTAITRAKKMVVIVGSQRTVETMVRNKRIVQRYSGLVSALQALGTAAGHEAS